MKKIIGFIIASIFVLGILLNIPSNVSEKSTNGLESQEFASLPGVKVPPLPPKE